METDVNTETDSEVEAQNITDCKDTKATITTTSKSVDCVNDQIVAVEEKQQESLRYIYKMQQFNIDLEIYNVKHITLSKSWFMTCEFH